ncbi:MAG: hypothetical protein NT010_11075 [Proteobacteria bacterium]|nr:hypothetical protein [Pseudomonadota bacterium]
MEDVLKRIESTLASSNAAGNLAGFAEDRTETEKTKSDIESDIFLLQADHKTLSDSLSSATDEKEIDEGTLKLIQIEKKIALKTEKLPALIASLAETERQEKEYRLAHKLDADLWRPVREPIQQQAAVLHHNLIKALEAINDFDSEIYKLFHKYNASPNKSELEAMLMTFIGPKTGFYIDLVPVHDKRKMTE